MLMRRLVFLGLGILGWAIVAIALLALLGLPAAQERAVANNDYAGVGLLVFSALFLLLPAGFVILSVGHMLRPLRGYLGLVPVLALGSAIVLAQVLYVLRAVGTSLRFDGGVGWFLLVIGLVAAFVVLDIRSVAPRMQGGASATHR